MDPISQGAIGALAAQTSVRHKNLAKVTLVGCLAGLAPDLDVLIQSREDPILFLEYHRQFTHSLLFIPFGSLLVAITLLGFLKDSLNFKTIYLASFLGFATHGLLDACTSYGTQLFWPFSNTRVSWNNISIVDPLFTLPIIFILHHLHFLVVLYGHALYHLLPFYFLILVHYILFYLLLDLPILGVLIPSSLQ